MFDIIGRRRYGYVLSAILVSLGLLFIIGTLIPNGNVGLQFSIAYTGGTVWEVHFEDGTPDPLDVRAVLEEQGLPGSEVAITTGDDREFVLIRTEALTLVETQVLEGSAAAAAASSPGPGASTPTTSPAPAASAAASASAAAITDPQASGAPASSPEAEASADAIIDPQASLAPVSSIAAETSVAASISPAASIAAEAAATPETSAAPSETGAPETSAAPSETSAPEIPVGALAGTDDGPVSGVPTEGQFGELAAALQAEFGRIDEVRQQNSVGPVVSAELIQQTFLLIVFAALAIMAWVTYRFSDFRMGVTAIVALLHDVVIVVGTFAVLGTLIGLQVDALFVTAMLTVIGYSVHDTIVVFDRIRENRQRYLGEPLEQIVNFSLVQTLGRSVTTSLTVVVTLLALLLFGGEAIRPFTLALLIGVIAGTYSSIFVATPLFLDWHLWDDRRKVRSATEPKPSPA